MGSFLTKEAKAGIFQQFGGSDKNTGKTESQIALFTARIKGLSDHLQTNKKDHSCRRALLHLVGKRKQLLNYLHSKDLVRYKTVLDQLGLRK
ncbi:MAG: 30S ribosomal protein S15 [Saprospiraceae bacterium]|jgi:small subunit ribosomal protein S15|nr:30S ribosomal protein S15 [Saprospiraceae bacterium]MBK8295908.1 30S ribosomal protein S15 [Saprospiraceae bacterium]